MAIKSKYSIYVRGIAIAMLFAMFHYMIGYRLVYSLGIICAKQEARESIAEKGSNIKTITLTASEFHSLKWTEKDEEFSYNNELYDMESFQQSGNSYIVKVFCDKDETGWVTSLHTYEKELFHPDQNAKGTKSAEDIMSSFQKDCTPATEFTIHFYVSIRPEQSLLVVQRPPLQIADIIWHPPVNC